MGKRKGVKANKNGNMNENGNGKGKTSSSSSTSMEMSKGQSLTTDSKIEGGGNSSKKMKRGKSLNSSSGEVEAGQSQESSVQQPSINNLPPENANSSEEPSTSSSSLYWTRSRKEAPYLELKELKFTRKGKMDTDDSLNSPDQGEAADESEGPINDLPPEMLMEILKCVDDSTLFDCRLVSRHWLEISSGVLSRRTEVMPGFKDYEIHWMQRNFGPRAKEKITNNRLKEFVDSMKPSKNCPYASFFFDIHEPSFFDDKDWIGFLSLFRPPNPKPKSKSKSKLNQIQNQNQRTKIKCLHLKCRCTGDTEELLLFTEKLRDLLLNKIPRLEELGLELPDEDLRNIELFPLSKNTESTTTTTKSSISALVPVLLPHLKILQIEGGTIMNFPGIIEDLLNAAVNLTTILIVWPGWMEGSEIIKIFQYLHSLGKLHLIKKVTIDVDEDLLSLVKKSTTKHQHSKSDFSLAFKVQRLKLYVFAKYMDPSLYADATTFISNLLESSKDTLEKLKMPTLGPFHALQFPNFTKLRSLKLTSYHDNDNDNETGIDLGRQFFPSGIRSRSKEIFPAVENLNLKSGDWERAFPQEDSIPIFPSVHTLCFEDEELGENVITKMGLMCPNLKHCTIQTLEGNPKDFNFPQIGRSIWTHLKQLEFLEVDVDVNLEAHAFPALDSCFTGISVENCQRLQELMEAEKTKNKSKSEGKLPESEEIMKLTQREHPSVLDLKSLKKLVINPHSGKKRHEGKNFFTTKITWISEEFAFKLMPQLQFNGRKSSASS